MPVTKPDWAARNFTPTSTAAVSGSAATAGVAVAGQREQGHAPGGVGPEPTVTVRAADGISVRALSSVARDRISRVPSELGVTVKDQAPRPSAGCQDSPSSVDTSTPPTRPPVSVADPL